MVAKVRQFVDDRAVKEVYAGVDPMLHLHLFAEAYDGVRGVDIY